MPLTVTRESVNDLEPHPRNARQGDIGAISESLRSHGQYRPIVAQRSTRLVLAGNHTLAAAKALGWDEIDVVFVDVDDAEAVRILLTDNRTADLGTYDDHALAELLVDLSNDGGLEGSGWDGEDLDRLIADLNADADTTLGEPAIAPRRHGQSLVLTFRDHDELGEFTSILERHGGDSYTHACLALARAWAQNNPA